MSEQETVDPLKYVPLREAAAQFGYKHVRYFRAQILPRLGLTAVKLLGRWYVPREQIEQWRDTYRATMAKVRTALLT